MPIPLEATVETSEIFGGIKDALRRAGSLLPINDVWIAAHGIEIDAVIITYDGHFKKVPDVRIWRHEDS